MWNVFHATVQSGLDILMPIKQIRIHPDDAPWMNQRLKSFIQKWQEAFNIYGVNSIQFKQYRNLVNRERKTCRANYYESKIQQFKGVTPRKWWQEVKRLSGMKSTNVNVIYQIYRGVFKPYFTGTSKFCKWNLPISTGGIPNVNS